MMKGVIVKLNLKTFNPKINPWQRNFQIYFLTFCGLKFEKRVDKGERILPDIFRFL